mgnify:FL=1
MPENDKSSNVSSDEECNQARLKIRKRRFRKCTLQCNENEEKPVVIPPPPPFPYHLVNLLDDEVSKPRITIEDLAHVKLRKTIINLPDAKSPAGDMMHILRKRYSVMHSPTPKKVLIDFFDTETDLDD